MTFSFELLLRVAVRYRTALLLLVLIPACARQEEKRTVSVKHGDLAVMFRDNSDPSRLSGIDTLINVEEAPDYDAYDPGEPGASAGLNFEHIISGHENPNNRHTPRHGKYMLIREPGGHSVTLVRRPEDSPWRVASTFRYTVKAPYYIDFDFRCTSRDASLFGTRGYALFFFANYMNDVEDVAIHFRGHKSADGPEEWISTNAPKAHPDWNGGGSYRALLADDLKYDDNLRHRLNHWSYDWPRIARPFYYGRAKHGMTLILMFDRLVSERDQIRFSLFKFKLRAHPRPAWDFQYVVNRVESNTEYGFCGRLVWKKFVSPEDCLQEYQRWAGDLEAE